MIAQLGPCCYNVDGLEWPMFLAYLAAFGVVIVGSLCLIVLFCLSLLRRRLRIKCLLFHRRTLRMPGYAPLETQCLCEQCGMMWVERERWRTRWR